MADAEPTGPTARALLALDLLQSQPGLSAADLGERLGVTGRAARRYVSILRDAGIPIESTPGRHGGYRVGRGLRLAPLRFDAAEAVGLVMAVLDGHHAARDPDDVVGRALGKIIRALPESIATQAELIRAGTAAAPNRWAARPDPAITTTLVEAGVRRQRVWMHYASGPDHEWSAEIDPWAVVIRHGRWYLLCWAHHVDELRTYRLDRITRADPLRITFDPPPISDPVAELEAHLARGWEHDVIVEIDAPADDVRARLPHRMGRVEPVDPDHCRVIGSTNNPDEYVIGLGVLPYRFRLHGDAFRTAAAELAARLQDATSD